MSRYSPNMPIRDALCSHPAAPAVFERFGLPCATCIASDLETLDSVAHMHDVLVENLIDALEKLADDTGEDVA